MPSEFTVIINVRQAFGDEQDPSELGGENEAPFVGRSKTYTFTTPNADTSEPAILQFMSRGVSSRRNIIRVNDRDIFGGLYTTTQTISLTGEPGAQVFAPVWRSNLLIVNPGTLRENNELFIESVNISESGSNLDNFIIDNAVLFYKLDQRSPGAIQT